jgi:hypothetical protein
MVYAYTMEYYSFIKKNEILLFASKWMELELIGLSKINWVQENKDCMFFLICGS